MPARQDPIAVAIREAVKETQRHLDLAGEALNRGDLEAMSRHANKAAYQARKARGLDEEATEAADEAADAVIAEEAPDDE